MLPARGDRSGGLGQSRSSGQTVGPAGRRAGPGRAEGPSGALTEQGAGGWTQGTLGHWILPTWTTSRQGSPTHSGARHRGQCRASCTVRARWALGVATLPGPFPEDDTICPQGPRGTGEFSSVTRLGGVSCEGLLCDTGSWAPSGQGRWVPGLSPGILLGLQWGPWPCKTHKGKNRRPERLCGLPEVTQQ